MLILVAFSFTLLSIAIALFMLAVLAAHWGGGGGGFTELAKHLSFGPNDKCFLLIRFPKD